MIAQHSCRRSRRLVASTITRFGRNAPPLRRTFATAPPCHVRSPSPRGLGTLGWRRSGERGAVVTERDGKVAIASSTRQWQKPRRAGGFRADLVPRVPCSSFCAEIHATWCGRGPATATGGRASDLEVRGGVARSVRALLLVFTNITLPPKICFPCFDSLWTHYRQVVRRSSPSPTLSRLPPSFPTRGGAELG